MAGLPVRWLRAAIAAATLVVLVVPAALGPTWGPLLRQLGAQATHVCKCGMKPGTCGCPDCARLEQQEHDDRAPLSVPALRRTCDDDTPALGSSALPDAVVPLAATMPPVPLTGSAARLEPSLHPASGEDRPPTPPPRHA